MIEGSVWFKRLVREMKSISKHVRFVKLKAGFYRIYFRQAYIGECFKNMPEMGYDIYDRTLNFEDYSYYQQHHNTIDTTLRVKNFVEGYRETKDKLITRLTQMRDNREFYEQARKGYSQMRIK